MAEPVAPLVDHVTEPLCRRCVPAGPQRTGKVCSGPHAVTICIATASHHA
jgi:hypothetical protein